jgi:hypothetical protein
MKQIAAEQVTMAKAIPPLVNGDHLTAEEFDRRYEAMPDLKKAELIEGRVYVGSPVSHAHCRAHGRLVLWLGNYELGTVGVEMGDNASVHLGIGQNRPQPDVYLRVLPECGGRSGFTANKKYVAGPPELIAEAALSSASYDLHEKLRAFERNGVLEYIVWRVEEGQIDWFRLRGSEYRRLAPDAKGVLRSRTFPGLWLAVPALLKGDLKAVQATLSRGLRSSEHDAFVARLARKAKKS